MSQKSGAAPTTKAAKSATGHSTLGAYVTGGAEFTRDTNYIEDRNASKPPTSGVSRIIRGESLSR
jgi:putative glutathione S-transferase